MLLVLNINSKFNFAFEFKFYYLQETVLTKQTLKTVLFDQYEIFIRQRSGRFLILIWYHFKLVRDYLSSMMKVILRRISH